MSDVEDLAKFLAAEHRKSDPNITQVFWLKDAEEVRLIEVTTSVPRDGEVLPFRFTPVPPDIPLHSLVVLLHPDDWARFQNLDWPKDLYPSSTRTVEIKNDGVSG